MGKRNYFSQEEMNSPGQSKCVADRAGPIKIYYLFYFLSSTLASMMIPNNSNQDMS